MSRVGIGVVIPLLVTLVAAPAHATPSDGTVVGATKIVNRGPDAERLNIVVIAEGFRANQLATFQTHAQTFASSFFHVPPFDICHTGVNIWRLDVTSTQAGADDPTACGGTGATVATYFDATFCGFGGIQRALIVNNSTVTSVLNTHVPQWDVALVVVNSTIHGGSASGPITTVVPNPGWDTGAAHEIGHSVFGLADEYDYSDQCGGTWTGAEPAEANVTAQEERSLIKWAHLIDAATPVPTMSNPTCGQCDNRPSPFPPQTIGLFEGARYHTCGLYRPAHDCMMRHGGIPFCEVCRERIRAVMATYDDPYLCPCSCAGDCNYDHSVTVDELVRGVAINLGEQPLWHCLAADRNGDGTVDVAELIQGVNAAQYGCPTCTCP